MTLDENPPSQPIRSTRRAGNGVTNHLIALFIGNTISAIAALGWSAWCFIDNATYRGNWSLFPIVWLFGTVILIVAQVVLSVLPSWISLRKSRRLETPSDAYQTAYQLSIVGVLFTVLGALVIVACNAL